MGTDPSHFKGENRPVESASWEDCQTFLDRLNVQLPGLALRLPTEAQWEYACRAGTETARYAADLDALAWYADNSKDETREVGQKCPNAWGLYDMLGDVYEWCHDGRRDYKQEAVVDPVGLLDAAAARVIRGGSWSLSARDVRAASRGWSIPGLRYVALGFRGASSGGSQPGAARATWSESQRQAEPAKTATRMPAARLLNLQRQPGVTTGLPACEGFVLSTDREHLHFGRITRPPWATEIGRDAYGLWVMFEVKGVRQRLRWIPPGCFLMGSPKDEEGRYDEEGSQHEVQLTRGFWLCDTPCTQALWQAVMGRNPSRFKGKNRPVEQVRWEDCQIFLDKLHAQLPGLALHLPTEAQWEYACRAGTGTARYQEELDVIAWYADNSNDETHEVGQKQPNAWGLYDMLGNVGEWCHDGRRDYEQEAVVDPVGPLDAGALRVIRGGSWADPAQVVRAANRLWSHPGLRYVVLGFRCASSG
jgi:formylglycine-generating enzyme required for sulfatase activity